jgi:hypothetical protein
MPGTHLLPPNLLKLFAPRPPLPYIRPVDRDIDRVTKKSVSGVGKLLEQLRETKTVGMLSSGEALDMEDGEEPSFTHAEETRRQIRREERKRRREEQFKIAKDTCNVAPSFLPFRSTHSLPFAQTSLLKTKKLWEIHTRLCSSLVWFAISLPLLLNSVLTNILL